MSTENFYVPQLPDVEVPSPSVEASLDTGLGLLFEQAYRVEPIRRRVEYRVAIARHLGSRRLASGRALGGGEPARLGIELVPAHGPCGRCRCQFGHGRLLSRHVPDDAAPGR
jgi:hypothetical protein